MFRFEMDILNISDDSDNEYIIGVDLEYLKELHDYHNGLWLAADSVCPPSSKLQNY